MNTFSIRVFLGVFLLVLGLGAMPACSITDPSDEDRVEDAMAKLPTDRKLKLMRITRKMDIEAYLRDKLGIDKDKMGPGEGIGWVICFNNDGEESKRVLIAVHELLSALYKWDGSGDPHSAMFNNLRENLEYTADRRIDNNCKFDSGIAETIDAAKDLYPDVTKRDNTSRVVDKLMLGLIAASVLAVVAPELIPVLCLLDVHVYCDTNGTPTPIPAPTGGPLPPSGDAP